MTRLLLKTEGDENKRLVLTRDLLDHLGATDAVEATLEAGRIVLRAASAETAPRPSFEQAMEATFAQYGPALRRLAGPADAEQAGSGSEP